jgi:16S rRNA (adenine1518-N6/adenine1519-N6)-dimethyltransferase
MVMDTQVILIFWVEKEMNLKSLNCQISQITFIKKTASQKKSLNGLITTIMKNSKNKTIPSLHTHVQVGRGHKNIIKNQGYKSVQVGRGQICCRVKKSLGQNFIKSEPALRMMCSSGEINSKDIILEIGPGKGALTDKLLLLSKQVIAIEKDKELYELLKEKYQKEIKNKKLFLINDDILHFNPQSFKLKKNNYKIIANIPYNITGAILKKFLSDETQPERMVLLVQKEVAERIIARKKKESILSLSINAYGIPKYEMKVHKRYFSPSPKVDSAIISIKDISRKKFKNKQDEENFFKIIKAGFAHKRKFLSSNLSSLAKYMEVGLPYMGEVFEKVKIDKNARAEDVKLDQWLILNKLLSPYF